MVRKSVAAAIATVILVTAAGCGQKTPKAIPASERAHLAEQTDPRAAQAANAFGLKLAGQMIQEKPGQNVVISPISVAQALAMTMNGAAGATREQIARMLHMEGMSLEELNDGQRKLRELLLQPGSGIKLSMANSLWLQKGWPFRQPYLDRVKGAYGAELNERNLNDPSVVKEINQWVNKKTNGLIPTIVEPPISEMTRMMLLNALYFNGTWQKPFEPKDTSEGDFTKGDGSKKRVPFMHQSGMFEYAESDTHQAVRLPYGDGQMGMLVVLPRPKADPKALAAKLLADPAFWTKRLDRSHGQLALPKFRVEGTFELKEALKAMGMSLPFDLGAADFSEMADASGGRGLSISKVLHRTLVDVSERGTEAAAATLVEMTATSAPVKSSSFDMTVDRPFLFAIQDLQSGALLFVGSVESP